MSRRMIQDLRDTFEELKEKGMRKPERVIDSPQGPRISLQGGRKVLNFCANNYLGFSADPSIIRAAQEAMEAWGYGLSSVRFICGTQGIHKQLEREIASFLRTDDAILYAACFDANGGLFEPLLGAEDAIISDELNHASIIDGVRLCKAARLRYRHSDMGDLNRCLKEAAHSRYRIICTDGVFSMDGDIANLPEIVALGRSFDALVMVDKLLDEGIYVIGFTYPVVPRGKARIRVQLSAAHSREDLEEAVAAFVKIGREMGVIPDAGAGAGHRRA